MTEQAFTGMKVLDLTHYIAGPFCTKLLADFGADVIKIERPGAGDTARTAGPFPEDVPDPEKSGLFLYLNTNKRGITLNLKTKTGVDIFKELVKQSDILIENFSPRVMPSLGLDYETLKKVNPSLIMTSISNFGQTGPYRDWKGSELTLFAMSGQMFKIGDPDREPLKHALNVAQYYAGKIASLATIAAAIRKMTKGYGDYIDISIFEILACDIDNNVIVWDFAGEKGDRKTSKNYPLYPWGGFRTKGGYVAIQGTNRERWESRLFAMIDQPDPKYNEKEREEHNDEINAMLNAWLMQHTKDEVAVKAGQVRYPLAPVFTTKELVNDRHYRERGTFIEIEHPSAGKLTYPGAPFKMSEAGYAIRMPAPLLGQHNKAVFGGLLGYSEQDLSLFEKDRSNLNPLPMEGTMRKEFLLSNVRIVEVGEGRVGPGAALLLCDLGAQVIKVESPYRIDMTRKLASLGPLAETSKRLSNPTPGFMIRNHNKLGVALDLTNPKGLDIFMRIVKVSDVYLSNMAVGAAEKLGITYQDLAKINPKIIYLSSTGYGRTGPYAKRVAMGNTIDAAAGLFGLRDYGDGDSTAVSPNTHCDSIAATTNAFSILTALYYREKTGKGTYLDASMVKPSISHIGEAIMDYSMNGRVWHSLGNRDMSNSPQGCYRCQGDDEWVTLSVSSDEEWQQLAGIMGKPQLATDKRFSDVLGRLKHQDDLDKLIQAWTAKHTKFEVTKMLQQAGIAAGAVSNNADIYSDPHIKERGCLEAIEHPDAGVHTYAGRLWKLKETELPKHNHAPMLGEHNEYVLREIAGLTAEEVSELEKEGIIGTVPVKASESD